MASLLAEDSMSSELFIALKMRYSKILWKIKSAHEIFTELQSEEVNQ